jgi:hypothetical protein
MRSKKTIGERLPKPNMLKLGDVVAIPLPNGKYGYGRQCEDVLAVYNKTTDSMLSLEEIGNLEEAFRIPFHEPTDHPRWIYLGKLPFRPDEDTWGPPRYIKDTVTEGVYRIYFRGRIRPAAKEEIAGLGPATSYPDSKVEMRILEKVEG